MDGFEKFMFTGGVVAIVLLICSVAIVYMHGDAKIAAMVEDGAHPIDARCAIAAPSTSAMCVMRANRLD